MGNNSAEKNALTKEGCEEKIGEAEERVEDAPPLLPKVSMTAGMKVAPCPLQLSSYLVVFAASSWVAHPRLRRPRFTLVGYEGSL